MRENKLNQTDNRKLAFKLFGAAVLMFGFGFAMVPLYDIFCEVTGLNGKTAGQVNVSESDLAIDKSRKITVQFLSVNNEAAQLGFGPRLRSIEVSPGEVREMTYFASNLTDREMKSHSVPSVSPQAAAQYLKKIECFCFQEQLIGVGETKEMPLRFYIEKDIPASITKLTLNYTIFDITEPADEAKLGQVTPTSDESAS